jgi:L-threonylcarbamoyladenylate synthase
LGIAIIFAGINSDKLEFEEDIKGAIETLRSGGTILYPTDTIWGIGCDATDPEAVRKLYELKKRTESKSLIVLVADFKDILKYVSHPDPAIFDFLDKLQNPTTVIYEGAVGLASNLVAEDGSVGMRVVRDQFCRHLIKRFRKPIVSSSANLSGAPSPGNFKEISQEVKMGVDYVVSYRQEERAQHLASTVVKLNRDGTVTTIRK